MATKSRPTPNRIMMYSNRSLTLLVIFAMALLISSSPKAQTVAEMEASMQRHLCPADKSPIKQGSVEDDCGKPMCGSAANNTFDQQCSNKYFACMEQHTKEAGIIGRYNSFLQSCAGSASDDL